MQIDLKKIVYFYSNLRLDDYALCRLPMTCLQLRKYRFLTLYSIYIRVYTENSIECKHVDSVRYVNIINSSIGLVVQSFFFVSYSIISSFRFIHIYNFMGPYAFCCFDSLLNPACKNQYICPISHQSNLA